MTLEDFLVLVEGADLSSRIYVGDPSVGQVTQVDRVSIMYSPWSNADHLHACELDSNQHCLHQEEVIVIHSV